MDFNINPGMLETKIKPLDPDKIYDVLIIGGGPAGLTASVYCIRKGMSTGIIVSEMGGQVAWTADIENYPGYRYISGIDLVGKFREQTQQFGIDFDEGSSAKTITDGDIKKIVMEDGRVFSAKSLIIATGKTPRKLNVPGEDKFTGRGVAFCSICDAPFFAGKKVIVVGGGNSGLEAGLDLAPIAEKVTILQNLEKFTGDSILIKKLLSHNNVEAMFNKEVVEINGDQTVKNVTIRDLKTLSTLNIETDGIFVQIGLYPNSSIASDIIETNRWGEIVVDCSCNTSRPGIFAAGDVTSVKFKQIIIAAGEGAKAGLSATEYVLKLK